MTQMRSITEASVASAVDKGDKAQIQMSHNELGWKIFRWLVIFAAAMAAALVAFAFYTYPRYDQALAMAGTTSPDTLQVFRQLRQEWVNQTISVGQLLVFSTLIPLIATTVGYLLGQGRRESSEDKD